jgi:hypothetical protein
LLLKSPDGATRRSRTAHLTSSECLVIIPGIPHPDKHIIRGGYSGFDPIGDTESERAGFAE